MVGARGAGKTSLLQRATAADGPPPRAPPPTRACAYSAHTVEVPLPRPAGAAGPASLAVRLGLGRIVTSHHRSSASYHIR